MEIYTVNQAAACLLVTSDSVRTWLRLGLLKGSKIGGGRVWRITEEQIQEFLKKGATT